jgi:hypothetical protein
MGLPEPQGESCPFEASRRRFLKAAGAGAVGLAGWVPAFEIAPRSSRATLPEPPAFPEGIPRYQQAYENWSREIRIEGLWTAAPRTPEELLAIVNWARAQGWRVRPKGRGHGWSPLLLPGGTSGASYLLVDTTRHLTRVSVDPSGPVPTVTAETGVSMDVLLGMLGAAGLGFTTTPAPGDVTLGGVLAVGGHGAALPAEGEQPVPGKGYGSLSNAVLALTAVVWDGRDRYRLRTFTRDDPGIGALLVHAGRAFITEATLQAGPDVNLRCRSFFHIGADELFAPPERAGSNAFQAWVQAAGRVEAIWFPFTAVPWLKVWSVDPERPWVSREVQAPYSYTFANWVSPSQARFIDQLVRGDLAATPAFQQLEMAAVGSGLILTDSWDIWGPSRYSNLYVLPTTLRLAENGYAVLTSRGNIQRVVSRFHQAYAGMVRRCQDRGEYPMNGPMEIRVTGLDQASEVCWPAALEPQLSSLRPRPDRPAWDCAVWINTLTFPGTPGENAFKAELEAWILEHHSGPEAGVRVEWAKGWGYTAAGAWSHAEMLAGGGEGGIPGSFGAGQAPGDGWDAALAALERMDPWRIFSNPFLDRLMPQPA